MGTRRVLTLVIGALAVTLGLCATAGAQTAAPTPAPAPTNPNWCPGVPGGTAPPYGKFTTGEWASIEHRCSNQGYNHTCMDMCGAARELWQRWDAGEREKPLTLPQATNRTQGPFLLPGGAKGYILPLASPPGTSGATPAPTAPRGSADPPGPFSSYPGQDLNALSKPPSIRTRQLQHVLAYHVEHHLLRDRSNLEHPALTKIALDVVLAHVTEAAQRLHGAVAGFEGSLGGA